MLKLTLYRSGQALKCLEFEAARISRQLAHAGGKVFSYTHQPPLPHHETNLVIVSVTDYVKIRTILLSEGLSE